MEDLCRKEGRGWVIIILGIQEKIESIKQEQGSLEEEQSFYRQFESVEKLLALSVRINASDLHMTAGVPPVFRINGKLVRIHELLDKECNSAAAGEAAALLSMEPELAGSLSAEDIDNFSSNFLVDERDENEFKEKGSVDLAKSIPGLSRFRVNVFRQRGSTAIVCRVLSNFALPMEELFGTIPGIISTLKKLAGMPRGIVLVTGPTGSGKSTTLASMIDYINKKLSGHIITLEDPIEYLHSHENCIVNQRELGNDVDSFVSGLRMSLREDPDVILIGEMRDLETISTAITAAETGHLVLSTLHTTTAPETVERIIDVYPSNQQQQVRVQLANVLQGIICQQLLPKKDGTGRVSAVEIMLGTPAVKNLIRDGKTYQISSSMQTAAGEGMVLMDKSLADLVNNNIIDKETAVEKVVDRRVFDSYTR